MASKEHRKAKKSRDSAKKDRKALVQDRKDARKGGASKADIAKITSKIMNKSAVMRTAGDTMREETGREKGQRTTYTGPAKQATINLIKKTTGQTLPEETKWQKVNAAWQNELMKPVSEGGKGLTRAQARTRLKTLFSKDRQRYLTEQQRRYDENIVADVVDVDDGKTKDGKVKLGGGGGLTRATGVGATGLGGLMMETDPYRRAAPLDWSNIMPQDTPLQSQQEIISGKGKYYQPWATRQDTPLSLINYDKPRGNIPAVSFIPPGSQVTAAYSGGGGTTADDGGGAVTAPGEPAGYVPPINPDTGIPFASFMDYTQYMHAKNQGLLKAAAPNPMVAGTGAAVSRYPDPILSMGSRSAANQRVQPTSVQAARALTRAPGSVAAVSRYPDQILSQNRTFPALAAENTTGLVNAPMNNNLALLDATVGDRSGYEWQHRTAGGPNAGLLAALFK